MLRLIIGKSLLLFVVLFASTTVSAKTRLVLHWTHQAQFAGYYVALEKGYYKEQGVDLVILPGGPDSVSADRLNSGEAHFGTMFLAAALERRAAGIPIVNISQIIQHSALMILTRKEDNISSIADLEGRKVAVWANDFQLQPWALFRKHDVKVSTVPFSGSMELFLRGAVPASLAMWYNEYHTVLSSGYREEELQPIFFKDTDFNFPEDGIYCLKATAEKAPELIAGMVDATLKGWEYTFSHETEALEIVKEYMAEANLPFSWAHQRWMLRIMKTIMKPEEQDDRYGYLSRSSFERVAKTLRKSGFSRKLPLYDDFVWSVEHAE